MNLRNRLATGAVAIALLAGSSVALAAPAHAAGYITYNAIDATQSGCKSELNSKIREKIMFGKTVKDVVGCRLNQWGSWSGTFKYSA